MNGISATGDGWTTWVTHDGVRAVCLQQTQRLRLKRRLAHGSQGRRKLSSFRRAVPSQVTLNPRQMEYPVENPGGASGDASGCARRTVWSAHQPSGNGGLSLRPGWAFFRKGAYILKLRGADFERTSASSALIRNEDKETHYDAANGETDR